MDLVEQGSYFMQPNRMSTIPPVKGRGGVYKNGGGSIKLIPDVSCMHPACIPGSDRDTTEYIRIQIRIQPDICIHTMTLHPLADRV